MCLFGDIGKVWFCIFCFKIVCIRIGWCFRKIERALIITHPRNAWSYLPPPTRFSLVCLPPRFDTQYRDGFVVDDGPYRRLDDPANADFLRSLAAGQTPRELMADAGEGSADVVVGLIDKRKEDYKETFRSFSGQGTSLGGATASGEASNDGRFDPASLEEPPAPASDAVVTSVQVRLLSGQRRVLRIAASSTVRDLAAHLRTDAGDAAFQLVAGFPPKPLKDPTQTVEEAGLKGAQVSMKRA